MRPGRILALALIGAAAVGCGGDDGDAPVAADPRPATTAAPPAPPPTAAEPEPAPAPKPLPGLPAFTAGYEEWERLNAAPIPPDSAQTRRVGFDAHRGVKDVHVSPGARRGPDGWPDGTIVVKAAGEAPDAPTLIAVMRKIAGSDPEHGDWEFVEYKRDGAGEAFATSPALRDATCWSCHAVATDTDWVFTPDDR